MDAMSDRLTMSLKPYLPSLCSPVAAMADPWERVADRDMDARHFFTALLASYPVIKCLGIRLQYYWPCDWLTCVTSHPYSQPG